MGIFSADKTSNTEKTFNEQVALNAGGFGISGANALSNVTFESGDVDVAKKALDTSNQIAGAAYETVYHVLDANSRFQDRALTSVDSAVQSAQGIASQAAPVSPGAYAEATSGQQSKTLVLIAAIIGAIYLILTLSKR